MPIERAKVERAALAARRARVGEPRDAGSNRGADRRIEPKSPSASLARVPDGHDLLRIGDRLALDLGTLGRLRCPRGGALAFLCAAVRALGPLTTPASQAPGGLA